MFWGEVHIFKNFNINLKLTYILLLKPTSSDLRAHRKVRDNVMGNHVCLYIGILDACTEIVDFNMGSHTIL